MLCLAVRWSYLGADRRGIVLIRRVLHRDIYFLARHVLDMEALVSGLDACGLQEALHVPQRVRVKAKREEQSALDELVASLEGRQAHVDVRILAALLVLLLCRLDAAQLDARGNGIRPVINLIQINIYEV